MKRNSTHCLLLQGLLLFSIAIFCFSCVSQKKVDELNRQYLYFQTNVNNPKNIPLKERTIQSGDLISIQVKSNSLNQEQTTIFNLTGNTINTNGSVTNATIIPSYMVNASGNIEMPVIGMINAKGLTKIQLEDSVVSRITPYVKNPVVIIRFADFKVNVLGEVRSPGALTFQTDKVTIIDALSTAGDLTDFAKREDITVLREEDGTVKHYTVDIRDGALFKSPVYQLKPFDIVYVGANTKKMKNLHNNTYNQKGTQIFLGVASLITALVFLTSAIIRANN